MPSIGIDVHHGRNPFVVEGLAVFQAIAQRNHIVIRTVHDKGRGSLLCHLLLIAVEVHQLLRRILAQEIVSATLVRKTGIHGDYRIKENLEVRSVLLVGEMCGSSRCQMSAGTASLNAQFGESPLLGMLAHQVHGLVHVFQWNLIMCVGQTVFQYGIGNALIEVPLCHGMTFRTEPYIIVSSSRTSQDGQSAGLLRNIHGECGYGHLVGMIGITEFRLCDFV